jgi:hypothetical protein
MEGGGVIKISRLEKKRDKEKRKNREQRDKEGE